MLIYLNLPELLCNCSKEIINIFELSQLLISQAADGFLDLYLKIIEENSVYIELCVSFIIRNIPITIRFAFHHHLLVSNSFFITDSMYLGTIQICQT